MFHREMIDGIKNSEINYLRIKRIHKGKEQK
jgi:hypothetical protein